jgi:hypothetical protein
VLKVARWAALVYEWVIDAVGALCASAEDICGPAWILKVHANDLSPGRGLVPVERRDLELCEPGVVGELDPPRFAFAVDGDLPDTKLGAHGICLDCDFLEDFPQIVAARVVVAFLVVDPEAHAASKGSGGL